MYLQRGLLVVSGFFLAGSLHAATVSIHVQDKFGKPSSKTIVYALRYEQRGPATSDCLIGTTNSSGNVSFKLDNNKEYEIIADKHGVGPTARAQLFNLSRLHLSAGASGQNTITLGQPFENRGLIAVNTANATPNTFLIGSVRNRLDGKDVAFAANTTDQNGNTVLVFNNIPPSTANAYDIQILDSGSQESHLKRYSGHVDPVVADEKTSVSVNMTNKQSARLPQ